MWRPLLAGKVEHWQALVVLAAAPVAWIPGVQNRVLEFVFAPPAWAMVPKVALLLLPALLFLWALWCTAAAFYTLLFRAHRRHFVAALLMGWWDAARAVWSYWAGLLRFVYVAAGWTLALARLALRLLLEAARRLLVHPVGASFVFAKRYARPGLPWVAVVLLVGWAALEASAFTYFLYPEVWSVLETAIGVRAPAATGPVLFLVIALVVLGSFACLDALREAVERRRPAAIILRGFVAVAVIGFEVALLYRPLAESVLPQVARRASFPPSLPWALALAGFAWLAVRGAAWFLFGRFGARPLAAVLSRRPLPGTESMPMRGTWPVRETSRKLVSLDVRADIVWLRSRARRELEALTLPVVQLLAAAVNLAVVVLVSRPVFSLPLESLDDAHPGSELLERLGLRPEDNDEQPTEAEPSGVTAGGFARLSR